MNRFLSKKNNNNKKSEKMDFPELVVSKKTQIAVNENSYKNVIKKEIEVKKETLPEGYIVLKDTTVLKNTTVLKDTNILKENEFLDSIISTQEYLDNVHEKYRENFIELHGEDLYDKYYSMTDTHIYIEEEEEEEEEDIEDDEY
jgi:hypothetical protein